MITAAFKTYKKHQDHSNRQTYFSSFLNGNKTARYYSSSF